MSMPPTPDQADPALPPAPPVSQPAPLPVVLPRYTPLILGQRHQVHRPPAPLAPPWPTKTEYWAHWTYTENEWRAWADEEFAKEIETRDISMMGIGTMLFLLLAVAGADLWRVSLNGWSSLVISVPLVVAGIVLGVFLPLWWVTQRSEYVTAKKLHQFRRDSAREAAIGPWWVWLDEEAQPLLRSPNSQMQVAMSTRGPLQLNFIIQEPIRNSSTRLSRRINVPIPHGHEAEARQLVARFRREVINTPAAAHPPRQVPTPPPSLVPNHTPAITVRLPPLPPLPPDSDTQQFDRPRHDQ